MSSIGPTSDPIVIPAGIYETSGLTDNSFKVYFNGRDRLTADIGSTPFSDRANENEDPFRARPVPCRSRPLSLYTEPRTPLGPRRVVSSPASTAASNNIVNANTPRARPRPRALSLVITPTWTASSGPLSPLSLSPGSPTTAYLLKVHEIPTPPSSPRAFRAVEIEAVPGTPGTPVTPVTPSPTPRQPLATSPTRAVRHAPYGRRAGPGTHVLGVRNDENGSVGPVRRARQSMPRDMGL